MGKKGKTIEKNQIKISKKCKDLNQLKQLKNNDELRKLLQKDYSTKRSTCDRIVNKLKGIPRLLSRNNSNQGIKFSIKLQSKLIDQFFKIVLIPNSNPNKIEIAMYKFLILIPN